MNLLGTNIFSTESSKIGVESSINKIREITHNLYKIKYLCTIDIKQITLIGILEQDG